MAPVSSSGLSSSLAGGEDTIVARATPPGRSALAVIRISGPATRSVLHAVAPSREAPEPWRAQLVNLQIDGFEDRAVAIFYEHPRSFTGEDMAELIVHGSGWLIERCLDQMVSAGARRAAPGEFSRRAVANGKMTLLEAEAVRDLVESETRWQARVARARMSGRAAVPVQRLRARLVDLLADVEGAVDFAQQGVVHDTYRVAKEMETVREELLRLAAAGRRAARTWSGLRVVIAGPPNAGKSTLFNGLLAQERAIVSPQPGTTRDSLEAVIELAGRPVVLVDTAGLRDGGGALEEEGVRRTAMAVAEADLVVLVQGADQKGEPPRAPEGIPSLRVLSRVDLVDGARRERWRPASLLNREDVEALRDEIGGMLVAISPEEGGEGLLSPRQAELAERVGAELEAAPAEAPELVAESLQWALGRLEEMLGLVTGEEVLDRIFATFCLGK